MDRVLFSRGHKLSHSRTSGHQDRRKIDVCPIRSCGKHKLGLSPPPFTRSLSLQGGIKDREVAEPSVTTIDTNLTNPILLLFESSGRTSSIEKNSKRTRKSESGTTTTFWKFPLLLFPLTKKWIPFPFCNKFIFSSYERTPLDSSRFIDRCCFFLN